MLTFIGLGLYDEKDVSIRGYEAIKDADVIFAEFYTSQLMGTSIEKLQKFYGKEIILLSREEVEDGKRIIEEAKNKSVVLIVPGDAMIATTHVALRIMAEEGGIETRIIHGASIVTAVSGLLGLQHYKFGRTISIPFPQENFFPTSAYDFLARNMEMGLHTLVLLDINPRPMTANEAMRILLDMEKRKKGGIIKDNTLIAVVARAGAPNVLVKAGYLQDMMNEDFGSPLHTIVIPGKLHFAEAEALIKLADAPEEILED